MFSHTCPGTVRKVADLYKDLIPATYPTLCALFALHAFNLGSLCATVRVIGWSPSVSTLDRAVQAFTPDRFMRRLRNRILRRHKGQLDSERFCFVVDDTLVEKFGKNTFALGYHGQHGKGGVICGQRVMVLALVDKLRGVAVPLAFALCRNKSDDGYIKANDLCFALAKEVIDAGFPPLPVVADSAFDSVELMAKFDDRNWTLVVECKHNRLAKSCPLPHARWKSMKDILHRQMKVSVKLGRTDRRKRPRRTKYVASRRVQIRGRGALVSACAVYNRASDGEAFAFYLSNDLRLSGADLWEFSRARWHIEEMFRVLKQNLSFLRIPAQGEGAAMLSICLPFALIASLHEEPHVWDGSTQETVGRILGRMREDATWKTVDAFRSNSRRITLLKLNSRRPHQDHRKKPVDPTAEAIEAWRNSA